jgi:hypothetical protein
MKFTSPLFSAVSGSIGGTTYSHNKGGMYARVRNTPPDKRSDPQLYWRPVWKALTLLWATLTEPERESWRLYASQVPRTDRLGQVKALSGHQHFFRSNAVRWGLFDSGTLIRSAPTIFNLGPTPIINQITGTVYAAPDATIDYYLPAGHPASGAALADCMFAFVSAPVGVTRTYRRNPLVYRNCLNFSSDVPAGTDQSFTVYNVWTHDVVQAAWLKVQCLYGDGRLSAPATFRFLTTLA